ALTGFTASQTAATQEANAQAQQLLIEQRNASAQGWKDYLASEKERKLGDLENAVLAAQKIIDQKKELTAEGGAQKALVAYYKRQEKKTVEGTLEYTQAHRNYLTALKAYRDLTTRDKQKQTG